MAEHEPCIGQSDDWYTPPQIFAALGLMFDLDPCSPGTGHWVPARRIFTKFDDGLAQPWGNSLVFLNPPFGGRNGHVPWLRRFIEHANGVAIVRAYTSSAWFHHWAVQAQTMLFPKGKTKFIRPDGSIGRAPGHGVVLLGMGVVANDALRRSNLGFVINTKQKLGTTCRGPSKPSKLQTRRAGRRSVGTAESGDWRPGSFRISRRTVFMLSRMEAPPACCSENRGAMPRSTTISMTSW